MSAHVQQSSEVNMVTKVLNISIIYLFYIWLADLGLSEQENPNQVTQ